MPRGGGAALRQPQWRGACGAAPGAVLPRAARLLLTLAVAAAAAALLPPLPAAAAQQSAGAGSKPNIHTLVLSDCSAYAGWQTLALAFSHRDTGQAGPLTRIMSCTDQEAKDQDKTLIGLVNTHIAPSYSTHPRTGDRYVAYNKPSAVGDWLKHFTPEEEWVLILEADMLLRQPITLEEHKNLKGPGFATGARYEQLVGVTNQLAARHLADVAPRNDWLAGPPGRRADQVGGFLILHRDDLRRVAPFWLKYTEDVRADADVSALGRGALAGGGAGCGRRLLEAAAAARGPRTPRRVARQCARTTVGPRRLLPFPTSLTFFPLPPALPWQAWQYAGDALAQHRGDKLWLAELYGYAFGAAKADVWHHWDNETLTYAGGVPRGELRAQNAGGEPHGAALNPAPGCDADARPGGSGWHGSLQRAANAPPALPKDAGS
jgi:hypothetical protein